MHRLQGLKVSHDIHRKHPKEELLGPDSVALQESHENSIGTPPKNQKA